MNIEIENLKDENAELKRALALLMNRELVRRLIQALKRIESGDYISEEEFFSHSHQ